MRDDLKQTEEETFIQWMERLHKKATTGPVMETDLDALVIFVNNASKLFERIDPLKVDWRH